METRTIVVCLAVIMAAVSANYLVLASRPVEEDSNSVRLQEDGRSLESDIRWLKEKTAELATVAERVKVELASRSNSVIDQVKRSRINKRHCWDVADVCCMWNIC